MLTLLCQSKRLIQPFKKPLLMILKKQLNLNVFPHLFLFLAFCFREFWPCVVCVLDPGVL